MNAELTFLESIDVLIIIIVVITIIIIIIIVVLINQCYYFKSRVWLGTDILPIFEHHWPK